MNKNVDIEALKADAIDIFNNGYACSEAVIYAIRKHFDLAIPDDAIAMSSGFPWGLSDGGCICGALAGGTMCLGYVYGRRKPGDDNSKVFELTNRLHQHFKETHGSTCCRVLTKGMEKASPERKAYCTTMVADTVEYVATLL